MADYSFDEEIAANWNRDLFLLWHQGEITDAEARYLIRRRYFHWDVAQKCGPLREPLLDLHDLLFEPVDGLQPQLRGMETLRLVAAVTWPGMIAALAAVVLAHI